MLVPRLFRVILSAFVGAEGEGERRVWEITIPSHRPMLLECKLFECINFLTTKKGTAILTSTRPHVLST